MDLEANTSKNKQTKIWDKRPALVPISIPKGMLTSRLPQHSKYLLQKSSGWHPVSLTGLASYTKLLQLIGFPSPSFWFQYNLDTSAIHLLLSLALSLSCLPSLHPLRQVYSAGCVQCMTFSPLPWLLYTIGTFLLTIPWSSPVLTLCIWYWNLGWGISGPLSKGPSLLTEPSCWFDSPMIYITTHTYIS